MAPLVGVLAEKVAMGESSTGGAAQAVFRVVAALAPWPRSLSTQRVSIGDRPPNTRVTAGLMAWIAVPARITMSA